VGSAIAVGAGIGGLSFFSVWMDRYQPCVIGATLLMLLWWLGRAIRAMTVGHGGGGAVEAAGRRGQAGAGRCSRVPVQLRPCARPDHGYLRRRPRNVGEGLRVIFQRPRQSGLAVANLQERG